ncbi:transglycosylase SLT domain-containing protein [Catellatospora sp. NPDC049609]|uniref:aggregation-promoting factor C-terminal-like domain-containing protein n=1 Tax=Catellatospora sp. NPDC049609 TaxID=3155505 RepID=UPI0034462046
MSTPRHALPRNRPALVRLLAVHSRKIALGVLCAGVLGAATYQVVASAGPDTPATDLAAARAAAAEAANRDYLRATPSPSLSAVPTPSASPSPSPTRTARRAPASAKPTAKRTTTTSTPTSCKSYSGNQLTACKLLPSFGFGYSQMVPLVKLWQHESGWNHKAENSGSGAYGIPQALPGDKMAKFGDDWRTNPATQIKWGLDYIKNRYDTPAGAWNHFQDNNWY